MIIIKNTNDIYLQEETASKITGLIELYVSNIGDDVSTRRSILDKIDTLSIFLEDKGDVLLCNWFVSRMLFINHDDPREAISILQNGLGIAQNDVKLKENEYYKRLRLLELEMAVGFPLEYKKILFLFEKVHLELPNQKSDFLYYESLFHRKRYDYTNALYKIQEANIEYNENVLTAHEDILYQLALSYIRTNNVQSAEETFEQLQICQTDDAVLLGNKICIIKSVLGYLKKPIEITKYAIEPLQKEIDKCSNWLFPDIFDKYFSLLLKNFWVKSSLNVIFENIQHFHGNNNILNERYIKYRMLGDFHHKLYLDKTFGYGKEEDKVNGLSFYNKAMLTAREIDRLLEITSYTFEIEARILNLQNPKPNKRFFKLYMEKFMPIENKKETESAVAKKESKIVEQEAKNDDEIKPIKRRTLVINLDEDDTEIHNFHNIIHDELNNFYIGKNELPSTDIITETYEIETYDIPVDFSINEDVDINVPIHENILITDKHLSNEESEVNYVFPSFNHKIENNDYNVSSSISEIKATVSPETTEYTLDDIKIITDVSDVQVNYDELGDDYYFGRNGQKIDYSKAFSCFAISANNGSSYAQYSIGFMYLMGIGVNKNENKALDWLKISAEKGHIDAQVELAGLYMFGESDIRNEGLAYMWNQRASKKGNKIAQYNLGRCYESGIGVEKNLSIAFNWYFKSADQGYSYAQNEVGLAYENGTGVSPSIEKAVEWYKKSAEQGNSRGQFLLANKYSWGKGVDQNYVLAFNWYLKSGEQGEADAQNKVGLAYENGKGIDIDLAKAVEWYQKSAGQGNAKGQYYLADMYNWGKGVEQSYSIAFDFYLKSAEQGYADAQNEVGYAYEYGMGVNIDLSKAVEWYQKSVEQGNSRGQYLLANKYSWGKGVNKDNEIAFGLYLKAAEQGYAPALNEIGLAYENGNGIISDIKRAVEYYMKSAEQGNSRGQYLLANKYYWGEGVEQNYSIAFDLYLKSAEQGDSDAQNHVGLCYEKGRGVDADSTKAIEWYAKAAETEDDDGDKERDNNLETSI